jgi:23S rRNA (cytidine1920-2'-O)/16S rRNA (cytidine1409-2'-O)-methyltransferase
MASLKKRIDSALVEGGFYDSLDQARRALMAGLVSVDGHVVTKPGTQILADAALTLAQKDKYVGRGGYKLEGALAHFGVNPQGLVCIDIGASTGGFTDCLLQNGAAFVYAIDVGHSQLSWRLQQDTRVLSREGVNARYLVATDFDPRPSLAVGDVSFISLTQILPAVFGVLDSGCEGIFLIKPQFEADRGEVEEGGLIRDPDVRLRCVEKIQKFVVVSGHEWIGAIESSIKGREGNVEYLAHFRCT